VVIGTMVLSFIRIINSRDAEFPETPVIAGAADEEVLFLFGPRATGKSFLVNTQLGDRALVIDLLRSDLYFRLSADPGLLEGLIGDRRGPRAWVVIDEVQKLPVLLDEVHRLIESRGLRFLLTGSSARKLRRGQANLLAGRAWTAHLHPLTWAELPRFDLPRFLCSGGLSPERGDPPHDQRPHRASPHASLRPRPNRRLASAEMAVRDRVKQAGGTWKPDRRVRQLRSDRAIELGLNRRIVDAPASNSGCRRSSGEHLHADTQTRSTYRCSHPLLDASILR
jgi:hypothetical protein